MTPILSCVVVCCAAIALSACVEAFRSFESDGKAAMIPAIEAFR